MTIEIVERIRRCVQRGCYDPVEIAEALGDVSAVEVAYHIDMKDLLPATVDIAETYEAETFPELVNCVPGILQKTRQALEAQYHQVMGAKLFADMLNEYLQDKNGVIFRSRPTSDLVDAAPLIFKPRGFLCG